MQGILLITIYSYNFHTEAISLEMISFYLLQDMFTSNNLKKNCTWNYTRSDEYVCTCVNTWHPIPPLTDFFVQMTIMWELLCSPVALMQSSLLSSKCHSEYKYITAMWYFLYDIVIFFNYLGLPRLCKWSLLVLSLKSNGGDGGILSKSALFPQLLLCVSLLVCWDGVWGGIQGMGLQ